MCNHPSQCQVLQGAPPTAFNGCQPSLLVSSHFRLKQLNLRTDQVHVDRLAADLLMGRVDKSSLKKQHLFVCLKVHFSKESKGFKPKEEMDLFWNPQTFQKEF